MAKKTNNNQIWLSPDQDGWRIQSQPAKEILLTLIPS